MITDPNPSSPGLDDFIERNRLDETIDNQIFNECLKTKKIGLSKLNIANGIFFRKTIFTGGLPLKL